MDSSMPVFPVLHHLPELTQTHVHWVSDAIQPSCPLLSPFPPAFNLSQHQGLFQWVSSSHQVPKVLELQLQYKSFPMNIQDWSPLGWTGLDLLAVQGTLKSLLQHHSLKASILCSQLFHGLTLTSIHDYWKKHRFTIWIFVCKVMSLLLNILSRFVIAFFPRSMCLLISCVF